MDLLPSILSRFRASLTAEIIGVLSGAVLTIVLARLLGSASYGVLFLAISILGLSREFSTFGIHKSTARYISEYKETNPTQIPYIIVVGFSILLLFIGVISALFYIGNNLIAELLNEPELSPYLLLGSLFIIFSTITSFVRTVTQGFEKIEVASVLFSLNKLGRVFFAVGLVVLGYGAIGAFVGYLLSYFVVSVVGLAYIIYYVLKNYQRAPIESGLRSRIIKYSAPIAVTQSAHTLDHHFDKILLGFFIGPIAVAYYTVGKQVIQFIETPMSALGFALSPTYGSKKASGDLDVATRIYEQACGYGIILYIPAAVGVIVLSAPGIELVFGAEYLGAVPVLQILSIYAVLQSVTKLTGEGLDYLGRARDRAVVKGVTAVLNLILNIALIPTFGVVGAAVASVISFGIYTIFSIYVMYLELDFDVKMLVERGAYSLFISGIMAFAIVPLRSRISGIPTLTAVVLFGGIIWLLFVVYFDLVDLNRIITFVHD